MDLYRFYAPSLAPGRVALPDDQAHHALNVLRLVTGTEVEVFDGRGRWGRGKLTAGKRAAWVEVVVPVAEDAPPAPRLTLATAVPKADRAEWLIEQASQLNVSAVQWLSCQRGVVKPRETGGKMDKWRRLAIESAKQCGRNWLLDIEPMRELSEVLTAARTRGDRILWLEPRGGVTVGEALLNHGGGGGGATALVGPEGGWGAEEFALLEEQAKASAVTRVRLTPTVLRIETACAAVAALVACHAGGKEG